MTTRKESDDNLWKEIKKLRDENKEITGQNILLKLDITKLNNERNELTDKLNSLNMEYTHLNQTVRSLHWALNVATSEIRRFQFKSGKFNYKDDWTALAE